MKEHTQKESHVMEPSPTQTASKRAGQTAQEQIDARIENGEFVTPPDINLLNQAWQELLTNEVRNRDWKNVYHDVCGLWHDLGWNNDANKVLL